jgi:hypothetical protein
MLDTQPDFLCDRAVYATPGCDVAGADVVGVGRETASGADERRLGAAVRLVDVAAFGARPARVARVDSDESHAREHGLVAEKRTELEEGPRVQHRALGLANRYPVSDAAEVFHGDTASGGRSLGRSAPPPARGSTALTPTIKSRFVSAQRMRKT